MRTNQDLGCFLTTEKKLHSDATLLKQNWRLHKFRRQLSQLNLDGFVIPRADEHLTEEVLPAFERLAWLTGYRGSTGFAIVHSETAAIFMDRHVDGEATAEIDETLFDVCASGWPDVKAWLARSIGAGKKLGYDPTLHNMQKANKLRDLCYRQGIQLIALDQNPIDIVWTDRPSELRGRVWLHDEEIAGTSRGEKCRRVAETIKTAGGNFALLSSPASIAWLLNIRGSDTPYAPVVYARALIGTNADVEVFVYLNKLLPDTRKALGAFAALSPPEALADRLGALGGRNSTVLIDPCGTSEAIANLVKAQGNEIITRSDPCLALMARKTNNEIAGMRRAHKRDGRAMVRFLAWLSKRIRSGVVSERDAAQKLDDFRLLENAYRGPSFKTISAAGARSAFLHYNCDLGVQKPLRPGDLYLIDSGSQYTDGTTDVTRTVSIGPPTVEQKDHFTRVLKGHIAVASASFLPGTTGCQIDSLARVSLKHAGLDYPHGTGHGVGSFLSVHEKIPQLHQNAIADPLVAGMVCSNEPGYYRDGYYGIRIESIVTVVHKPRTEASKCALLAFDTLTLVPIEKSLIELSLLNKKEADWLNAYHKRVFQTLVSDVEPEVLDWLKNATSPIDVVSIGSKSSR